ncbi:MAG: TonB-dependent receptor plug domain-containing protein, partial [Sinobacteraceae bacterium]|nr:TonB-dependent receptor plug domain-containing protein [Nevskiaceae bacterium]
MEIRSVRNYLHRTLGMAAWGLAATWGSDAAIAQQAPATAAVGAPPTQAPSEDTTAKLEEIVITGTSIRNTAPVGTNLITVGREAIADTGAQTMQQILATVPAVTGFGNAAQGGFGSADLSGTYAPTIHGLGASASNGTLVLIDGRRLPLSGINHTLADPNIIAPLSIERVEVLPDGASSTYGSDAVAGVINFITRRNFKGFEVSGQAGRGNSYNTEQAGFLWGDAWEASSIMISYDYERRSALSNADRLFTRADHTPQGGGNFATFNCWPASTRVGSHYYLYPYNGTAVAAAPCDYTSVADTLPEDTRNSVLVKVTHDLNERVSVDANLVYSSESNTAKISRGILTTTVYGPGSTPPGGAGQINPFFKGPPGATSETIGLDANNLLGRGPENQAGAKTLMGGGTATAKLFGDWLATAGVTFGSNQSTLWQVGQLCTSCANLALNGTTNASGNPTTPSIAGTTTAVTNFPLTAANALDVWDPVGANLTSPALMRQLTDSTQWQLTNETIKDFSLKVDGSLFDLPGGS